MSNPAKPVIVITLTQECVERLKRGQTEDVEHEHVMLHFRWANDATEIPNPPRRGTGAYIS